MADAIRALGAEPLRLGSGAGHDGQAMAKLCPIGMLFVRCRGGISHNPMEYASPRDLGLAVAALIGFIERFDPAKLALEADRGAVQIVLVGALDLHRRDLADAQRAAARHIDRAVDLRRVALAAAFRDGRADFVDDDLLARADFGLEALRRDRLLALP